MRKGVKYKLNFKNKKIVLFRMSNIFVMNNTDSKKNVLGMNYEKNSDTNPDTNSDTNSEISKTFFENNDTIATFFDNVAESLKSLPSISSNSDTESNISSAELREIEEFMEKYVEKSNRLCSISEEKNK